MARQVRGCHHCIGTGVTVTNLVFKFIEGHAIANNAILPDDVAELRRRVLESFTSGYDFFEARHRTCSGANDAPGSRSFSRDTILASLLSACARRAAEIAFKVEIAACGPAWIDDFFAGFAQCVVADIRPEAEPELINAFVEAAGKHKSQMTVAELLQEPKAQAIIKKCTAAFNRKEACSELGDAISKRVNDYITQCRNIVGPNAAKTTKDDMQRFLEMLPKQIAQAIKASQSRAKAHA